MTVAVQTKFGTFIEGQEFPTEWRSPLAKLFPFTANPAGVILAIFINPWGVEIRIGDAMTKLLVPWSQIEAVADVP